MQKGEAGSDYQLLDLLGVDSRYRFAAEQFALAIPGMTTQLFADLVDRARVVGRFSVYADKLAGIAMATFDHSSDECQLRVVAVDPEVQGEGIGRELLADIDQLARDKAAKRIIAGPIQRADEVEWYKMVLQFLSKNGYRHDETTSHSAQMVKKL